MLSNIILKFCGLCGHKLNKSNIEGLFCNRCKRQIPDCTKTRRCDIDFCGRLVTRNATYCRYHHSMPWFITKLVDALEIQSDYGHLNWHIWHDRLQPLLKEKSAIRGWHRFVSYLRKYRVPYRRDQFYNLILGVNEKWVRQTFISLKQVP